MEEAIIQHFTNYIMGKQGVDGSLHSAIRELCLYGDKSTVDTKITARCVEKLIQTRIYRYSSEEEIRYAMFTTSKCTGNEETITILLKYGANINWKDPYEGKTSIYHPIQQRDYEMVEFMIKNGANLNVQCNKNLSPLDWAKSFKDNEKIIELIENSIKKLDVFTFIKSLLKI